MSDDDEPGGDWEPGGFSPSSTLEDLERAIRVTTDDVLADLRAQLAADPDFIDADRIRAMSIAEPVIRRQTREALEASYARTRPVH